MTTALYTHDDCLLHTMGDDHPECPERINAILSELNEEGLSYLLNHREAPILDRELLSLAHSTSYIKRVFETAPCNGIKHLDEDATMNPYTLTAALRAAGAAVAAVDAVIAGEVRNAFCLTRPPGHHAERERAMGFCFFGNISIAALHALEHHNLKRVAILDFDVHHGNGTENILKDDPRVLFCSSFQHPHYPNFFGESVNGQRVSTPLSVGCDGKTFRNVIEKTWLPAIRKHKPEFIFISAGFDAHSDDPLGGLDLSASDFSWATKKFILLAEEFSKGRMVSILEGGYNLKALGQSATAHILALMKYRK